MSGVKRERDTLTQTNLLMMRLQLSAISQLSLNRFDSNLYIWQMFSKQIWFQPVYLADVQ